MINIFEFMSDSPVLSFFLVLITYMLIESLFKIIFKRNNDE